MTPEGFERALRTFALKAPIPDVLDGAQLGGHHSRRASQRQRVSAETSSFSSKPTPATDCSTARASVNCLNHCLLQRNRNRMSYIRRVGTILVSIGCLAPVLRVALPTAYAQTAYPMLMSLKPAAVQVGQTAEVTVNARYSMVGAYQVLISGEGVTGEVVHPPLKLEELGQETDARQAAGPLHGSRPTPSRACATCGLRRPRV